MAKTKQEEVWSGEFGKDYTDRNLLAPAELDSLYEGNYGISRTSLNKEFLDGVLEKYDRILEVGCNVGNQLDLLKTMGYSNLWGVEIQSYAVEVARKRTSGLNIVLGSAFDLPFKDDFFDMVFTAGVLIHISPSDINKALDEIHRCAASYIGGFEYYSEKGYEMINYRGKDDLLWKTDFPKLFLDRFPDAKLLKKKVMKYTNNDNRDVMYLLKKG
ncbi:MAG: methyltransferase domain-containing protein [Candidatus Altiarchaeota archaeon]|nr:methyltransferase domain-containing protein [Candidatus Altiarchaeota archaeon]